MFDSLASDGAVTEALTSIASLPESVNVPSVFLSSTLSTPRSAKAAVRKVEAKTIDVVRRVELKVNLLSRAAILSGVLASAENQLPEEWKVKEWWTISSVERHARACIPEGVLDAVGIDGTYSHLISSKYLFLLVLLCPHVHDGVDPSR